MTQYKEGLLAKYNSIQKNYFNGIRFWAFDYFMNREILKFALSCFYTEHWNVVHSKHSAVFIR